MSAAEPMDAQDAQNAQTGDGDLSVEEGPTASHADLFDWAKQRFERFLRSKGNKLTSERLAILELCTELPGLIRADDLIDVARGRNQRVSKATVYRTLALLVDAGVLFEHRFTQNKTYYGLATPGAPQIHLICERCGRIIEYSTDGINEVCEEACRMMEFSMESYHLQIRGVCKHCHNLPEDPDGEAGFDPRSHPLWRMKHLR